MAQQTFEEWWSKLGAWRIGVNKMECQVSFEAGRHACDEKVKALQNKLLELEGIDKACDASQQHVLLLQKDVDELQARIERTKKLVEGIAKQLLVMLEEKE
jgi:hypothetical protein